MINRTICLWRYIIYLDLEILKSLCSFRAFPCSPCPISFHKSAMDTCITKYSRCDKHTIHFCMYIPINRNCAEADPDFWKTGALANTFSYINRSDFWNGDLPVYIRLHAKQVLNIFLHFQKGVNHPTSPWDPSIRPWCCLPLRSICCAILLIIGW